MFNNKELVNKIIAVIFLICLILSAVVTTIAGTNNLLPATIDSGISLFNQCSTVIFLAINILFFIQIISIKIYDRTLLPINLQNALAFAIFIICCLAEVLLASDFFANTAVLSFISHQLLLLLFVPFIIFIDGLINSKGIWKVLLAGLLVVDFVLQNILNLVGLWSLTDLFWLTQTVNLICLLTAFYQIFQYRGINKLLYYFCGFGTLIFAICCLLDIIANLHTPLFWMLGCSCFTAGLFCLTLTDSQNAVTEQTKNDILSKHAMIDYQTGYGSRLAFDQYYYGLDNYFLGTVKIGALVIDLNNLKETNDTYGNQAGDELIKGTAICIGAIFDEYARCFRTGGDEFAVLAIDSDLDMEAMINQLDSKIIEYNTQHVHQISIARGICTDEADVEDQNKLRLIYKAADDRMYADKIQKHEQMKVQMIQEKYLKKQMLQEQMIREKQFQAQMKKVAEAKQAEDLKKQTANSITNEPIDQNAETFDHPIKSPDNFWGETSEKKPPLNSKKAAKPNAETKFDNTADDNKQTEPPTTQQETKTDSETNCTPEEKQ